MSVSDRQNRLLINQDWKRIYQSFRNADFQSYDFENLRRTMIQYLREKKWQGILLLDDIHKSGEMKSFWNTFDEESKVDVTAVGHQSGTGLVEFE